MPSLTIQYLSDSATIELSRDCGLEGVKRLTCSGKQDQDFIQRELMCMSEREHTDSYQFNEPVNDHISHMFENEPSNNMENNNLENLANQIEASVEKLNDKFNSNELMMGDQPIDIVAEENKENKRTKNGKKSVNEPRKKLPAKQLFKTKSGETLEDLMMADAPAEEVLPHNKKMMPSDLKRPEDINISNPKDSFDETATPENRNRRETDNPTPSRIETMAVSTEPNLKLIKIMHNSSSNRDHFVPPMLLVHHENFTIKPQSVTGNPTELETTSSTTINKSEFQQNTISTNLDEVTTSEASKSTQVTSVITSTVSNVQHLPNEHDPPKTSIMMRPHAPKFGGEIMFRSPVLTTQKHLADVHTSTVTPPSNKPDLIPQAEIDSDHQNLNLTNEATTTESIVIINDLSTVTAFESTSEQSHLEIAKRSNGVTISSKKHQHKNEEKDTKQHADFTNSNVDFQRYKPNRKRILTKPETHTYIQKIFG